MLSMTTDSSEGSSPQVEDCTLLPSNVSLVDETFCNESVGTGVRSGVPGRDGLVGVHGLPAGQVEP